MKAYWVLATTIGLGLLCSAAYAQSDPAGSAVETPGLSLTIAPVAPSVKIGSPVVIKVTLKNESDHDFNVTMARAGAACTYRVEVRDENAVLAPDSHLGVLVNGHVDAKNWEGLGYTTSEMLNGCGSMLPTKVKAGEIFEETLPVTVLYDLAKPGKYSIEVAVKRIDFDPVYLKSNKVTVTVTP